jgi:hypothetical protein
LKIGVEVVVDDVERTERVGKRWKGIRGDEHEGRLLSTFAVTRRLYSSTGTWFAAERAKWWCWREVTGLGTSVLDKDLERIEVSTLSTLGIQHVVPSRDSRSTENVIKLVNSEEHLEGDGEKPSRRASLAPIIA